MTSILDSFWIIFTGTIRVWNDYIRSLQGNLLDEEKQLVIPDITSFPHDGPVPNPKLKKYTEGDFQWNLNGKIPFKTKSESVNLLLEDFGYLNIDAYHMVLETQTLPDSTFIHKRYISVIRDLHPDKGGETRLAARVNVAKEHIDRLYGSENEQMELFEYIYNSQPTGGSYALAKQAFTSAIPRNHEEASKISSSPFIILYLVGAAAGIVLVLISNKQRKKVQDKS